MALVPIFHGQVAEDGSRIVFDATEQRLRHGYLRTLAGKRVDVVVRIQRSKRSDKQSRWWWGIAVPLIAQELGYDKHDHEQLHYALVSLCFGSVFDKVLQKDVPKVRSSQLSTTQFSELMEWTVRWAAQEYGIRVPLPNEAEWAA